MADRVRRFAGVRARTTAAAVLIVAVALVVIGGGLMLFVRQALLEQLDEVGYNRAGDVAALARQGNLPVDLAAVGDDGHVTQVVDDAGHILSSTVGSGRVFAFQPAGARSRVRTVAHLPGSTHPFRVVAERTDTPRGPATVYVASSTEPVDDAVGALGKALVVGGPLLLLLVGLTTWAVVGRALRPVDVISAEVADLSDRSLDKRVSVPPTGDEISRLAVVMNTMLGRMQRSAERQRRFVADASHELQTPLAAARTDLEVALAHPDRTDFKETALDLLAANRRMERLVRDLLYLARADSPAARRPSVPVDLDDVVLTETSGRDHVDTGQVSPAGVLGRRDDLARAVRNVLDNAERYASTMVTVALTSVGGWATLVIADDGPGVPAADRDRVFERFTRLDSGRDRGSGGTGLGLAIARETVEAHGGTISVEDADPGARVVMRIPAI
jgi:signal transduction histidine kinase